MRKVGGCRVGAVGFGGVMGPERFAGRFRMENGHWKKTDVEITRNEVSVCAPSA